MTSAVAIHEPSAEERQPAPGYCMACKEPSTGVVAMELVLVAGIGHRTWACLDRKGCRRRAEARFIYCAYPMPL